ncbi:MAG: cysteine peptidase family C39 domain-containing protein [Bacteroidota bacterium]
MKANIVIAILTVYSLCSCFNFEKPDHFPIILQDRRAQCGPVCLQMISEHYGREMDLEVLERLTRMDHNGTSLLGVSDAADSLGFRTLAAKIPFDKFVLEAPLPGIVHWRNNHFAVVYKAEMDSIWVADPAVGKIVYSAKDFKDGWIKSDSVGVDVGVVLLMETTDRFYRQRQPNVTLSKQPTTQEDF